MRKHLRLTRLLLALALLLVIAACGDEPAADAPIPEDTAVAVAPADEEPAPADEEPAPADEPTVAPERGDGSGASSGADGSADTSGTYASDLGFRPDANGFSFENYGGQGETNLTPSDVQRLFGDQACATIQDGQCILTPPGEQWLQQINQAMNGGHCEGMAVLSNLLYTGQVDANSFGAASTPELQIAGNEPLQREIAYWWATQATQPARSGIVQQTPSGVVNTLLTSFAAGPSGSDQYALGIYKRDFTGGHAITPYAVEDRGNGIYWILVYDNNYPGQARAVEVDTNNDTWSYSGSTNPAEAEGNYEGDASTTTLELAPIGPRLGQQECPFCQGQASARAGGMMLQAGQTQYNEIWLEGDADLLITDAEGRSVGFRDGVFVNEIDGSLSNSNKFGVSVWDENAEPVYYIPTSIDFTISIDGSRLTEPSNSTVTMIGPGYALEVSDIILDPGQVDTLDVSPDGSLLSYRTESGETPFLLVAVETDAADYQFGVYGEAMAPGEALNLSLDTKEGWLSVDSIDNSEAGSYSLVVARYDDTGEQVFGATGIELQPDDVVYVDYLLWPGNGEPMALDVDYGGDGTVDETLQVDDVTDEFAQ
ncbi:hypothetical protein K2Z83_14910 [Oscillochloris sp. ZM17-4]|uniref:hypothetical protein n=1 Tax=Oscillochloris sp. ZM17-4 TaxID=2866714 RepID=UPI001C73D2C3|nr:hypothetical protein [Oscillochloris sp. ZM17-4]MBX0328966.1 hypothetical protein [Oscillochloris sp. ZM17-4]